MRIIFYTLFIVFAMAAPWLAWHAMAYDTVCYDGLLYDNWGYANYILLALPVIGAFISGIGFNVCKTDKVQYGQATYK